jgi:hypothetical protein
MSLWVVSVDLVKDDVLVTFSDGTATIFSATFLNAHRNDKENTALPDEGNREIRREGGGRRRGA